MLFVFSNSSALLYFPQTMFEQGRVTLELSFPFSRYPRTSFRPFHGGHQTHNVLIFFFYLR